MGSSDRFTFQRPLWMASYQTPMHPSYAGNPLILALPPAYTPEQALHCLRLQPPYEDEWRLRPAVERMETLLNAADFFQPLTQHLDLEQRFSRMLRRGYVGRNPLDHGYWAHTHEQCKTMSEFVPGTTHQAACVQGFTLLGISGIGKSRALERILSLYPQVVLHEAFAGKRFTWVQLVWLKLDCPQDGSLKGLCQGFFEEVDAILGTNYYATYAVHGKASTDQMLVFMARVARLHSIGTMVIDELQNLRQANGNMAERVLNFFVQLDNTIGVPIILVGTPKALDLLAGEFRRARRAVGQGDPIWNRMPEQDADWQLLIDTLWGYQLVREPCPLTPGLRHLLYEESQGITDIAIKLYFLAQMNAIFQGKEQITAKLLHQTAQRDLQLVQPFVTALRTNDQRAIRVYEDIRSIDLRATSAVALNAAPSTPSTASLSPSAITAPVSSEQSVLNEDPKASQTHPPKKETVAPETGYASFAERGLTRPITTIYADEPGEWCGEQHP